MAFQSYEPPHRDRSATSTRELFQELFGQGQRLVREEVRLARLEVKDEVKGLTKGGSLMGAAAVVGLGAFLVLCFAAVFALSLALPAWAAALIVGAVLAIGAAALFFAGRTKIKRVPLKPEETLGTLREDQRWANETMRSAKSTRHASA